MIRLFFLTFFLFVQFSCFGHTLSEAFTKAEVGDFVVFAEQKHLTLFRIAASTEDEIAIEEITIPASLIDLTAVSWKKWLEEEAPHYSSWTVTRFEKKSGTLISCLSKVNHEWIENKPLFVFLPTLFQLPLVPVPKDEQKRIGPAPMAGEIDRRKLWVPKVIVNGKELLPPPPFEVYRTKWPKDGGELSEKTIYLYFPVSKEALSYFPYWVEIVGIVGKVKLRVVDSGKGL